MEINIDQTITRLLKKDWSPEIMQKYIGDYQECFLTYASDNNFRENAASGGSVTALLSYLFTSGQIHGALVCRSIVNNDGKLRAEFFIARSIQELKSSQGSKYMAVNFASQALPLIRSFQGNLAIVALPCDVSILQHAQEADHLIAEKIILIISLFCGHNSEPVLTDYIINKLRPNNQSLVSYRYRIGHWRGSLQAVFSQDKKVKKPFSYFSDYQNLYFFSQKKCHHCSDHTGYHADISAGDIWSLAMKHEPIKHTALIARTSFASKIVKEAFEENVLIGKRVGLEEVCEGQTRTLPFHYNVSARAKVSYWLGEKIKDTVNEKVRFSDYIVAWMCLANERISRTTVGQKIIFAIPRPILKTYLYLMKLLESF